MKISRFLPLVVGSAAAGILSSMSPSQAITWQFNNFSFSKGFPSSSYPSFPTASGTFFYDPTINPNIISNVNITATVTRTAAAGGTVTDLFNTGTVTTVAPGGTGANSLQFTSASGSILDISFLNSTVTELNNQTNPPVIDGSLFVSSINFGQGLRSGATLTPTPVPFNTTPGAILPAIPILALMHRWKQSRSRIALKTTDKSPRP